MPTVSSHINTSLRGFISEYSRKKNSPLFHWLIPLFFSKKLRLILERLSLSSEDVYAYHDVKECFNELGQMGNLMVWLAGFFFQLMRSRLIYVYRFLDDMHQSIQSNGESLAEDFFNYSLIEGLVGCFDYFWLANHWSDLKQRVMHHSQPFSLLHTLVSLHKSNMLYDWSVTKILPVLMKHSQPLKLLNPLKNLANANMLTGHEGYANLAGFEHCTSPDNLANALIQLKQSGLLNQNMRAILLTQSKPLEFSKFLICLSISGQLPVNQRTVKLSEMLPYTGILTGSRVSRFWVNIPATGITNAIYQQILEICRLPNIGQRQKEERLADFLNRTFFPNQVNFLGQENQNNFNPAQSTHTASINRSIIDSILNLTKRYGNLIDNHQNVLKYYQKLRQLVLDKCHALNDDLNFKIKCDAAIKALQRIDSGALNYHERATNTDIFSLFALIYCAVHDKQLITADIDDFLILLIDSLYQLQRGYNLSEKAEDNGLADNSVCFGGSFAKIFESICALHKDCFLIYVTAQSITNKMIRVVNEEIKIYLDKLPYEQSKTLLDDLKANGLNENIWQVIKTNVEAKMHAEFDDVLAMSSVSKTEFDEILSSASEVPLYLDDYQLPVKTSLGNQFFKNNGTSAEAVSDNQLSMN